MKLNHTPLQLNQMARHRVCCVKHKRPGEVLSMFFQLETKSTPMVEQAAIGSNSTCLIRLAIHIGKNKRLNNHNQMAVPKTIEYITMNLSDSPRLIVLKRMHNRYAARLNRQIKLFRMPKYRNILVIEDDKSSAFLIQLLLRELNLVESIAFAAHGEEGLDYLMRLKANGSRYPEYIFLDLNMPIMDGFEFIKKCRQSGCVDETKTRIIILTSSTHGKDVQHAKELGVAHYLNKPISEEELLRVLGL
jgi:CheY-like chemotaxis protein